MVAISYSVSSRSFGVRAYNASMRTWLRGYFAWRFSLRRLLIATVFLGAVVGLNVREIGPVILGALPGYCCGWPFPIIGKKNVPTGLSVVEAIWLGDHDQMQNAAASYQVPWTHQTYCLLNWKEIGRFQAEGDDDIETTFVRYAIIDALVALIPFFSILFLQIPRRPRKAEA